MKHYKFEGILTKDGWLTPAYVSLARNGSIYTISQQPPEDTENVEQVDGYAIPGFQNAHAHAFQYAMAGIA